MCRLEAMAHSYLSQAHQVRWLEDKPIKVDRSVIWQGRQLHIGILSLWLLACLPSGWHIQGLDGFTGCVPWSGKLGGPVSYLYKLICRRSSTSERRFVGINGRECFQKGSCETLGTCFGNHGDWSLVWTSRQWWFSILKWLLKKCIKQWVSGSQKPTEEPQKWVEKILQKKDRDSRQQ